MRSAVPKRLLSSIGLIAHTGKGLASIHSGLPRDFIIGTDYR